MLARHCFGDCACCAFSALEKESIRKDQPRRMSGIGPTWLLRRDPHNRGGKHKIKKLIGLKPGEGQWRIRWREYRLRYDIFADEVATLVPPPKTGLLVQILNLNDSMHSMGDFLQEIEVDPIVKPPSV